MNKLVLHTVSRDEISLINEVVKRNGGVSLSLGKDAFDLFFAPFSQDFVPEIELGLSIGERRLRLGLEKLFFMNLLEDILPGERITDLPEDIRDTVFETVLEELLDRFDDWNGSKTSVLEVNFKSQVEDLGQNVFFNLIRSGDKASIKGQLSMNLDDLAWFSALINRRPVSTVDEWDHIPVRARFEVGRTRLALDELEAAAKQDIIFLDECPFKEDTGLLVRLSPHLYLKAVLKASSVVVEKVMEDGMVDEESQREAREEDSEQRIQASSIDELPVNLVFDLGEKTITVGDLKTLQPGYTFELDRAMDKPVSIRANEKMIGFGELVQVDDRIGVRILELFQR